MQAGDEHSSVGVALRHHDVEVVERLVVRRVERRLRRSHGDDELEPELRREQPGLERQLLGGGPGDRLGHQRGHEHRQHLHLQHGRPERGRDLPGDGSATYGTLAELRPARRHRVDRHLDGQRHRTTNATDDGHHARAPARPPAAGERHSSHHDHLAANTFTEAGYTFAGWSDGSAT